jgi:hypothetical protein
VVAPVVRGTVVAGRARGFRVGSDQDLSPGRARIRI